MKKQKFTLPSFDKLTRTITKELNVMVEALEKEWRNQYVMNSPQPKPRAKRKAQSSVVSYEEFKRRSR